MSTTEFTNPTELRDALIEAVERQDVPRLSALCRINQALIEQHFLEWRTVPAEMRGDSGSVQRYAQGLIAVAQYFAHELGNDAPLVSMMGKPEDNPLLQWKDKLQAARDLMEKMHYADAADMLGDMLVDARNLRGTGVDQLLPLTFGWLGECLFQVGDAANALGPMEQALALCQAAGENEGVLIYTRNLFEIHRYLGNAEKAAEIAEHFADLLAEKGQTAEAHNYRRHAAVIRQGEPLARVVLSVGDEIYELDDLPAEMNGRIGFAFARNRMTLRPAQLAIDTGEKLAEHGEFEAALTEFLTAAGTDKFDPQSHYEAGITYLQLGRYADAVEQFDVCEELAPGWYNCRSDRWLAAALAAQKLPPEVFQTLRILEDGEAPPPAKIKLAEQVLAILPDLPLLHLFHGIVLASTAQDHDAAAATAQREAAVAAFEAGLACADEIDVKTRLHLHAGLNTDDAEKKREHLQAAAKLNGNRIAAAMATVALHTME